MFFFFFAFVYKEHLRKKKKKAAASRGASPPVLFSCHAVQPECRKRLSHRDQSSKHFTPPSLTFTHSHCGEHLSIQTTKAITIPKKKKKLINNRLTFDSTGLQRKQAQSEKESRLQKHDGLIYVVLTPRSCHLWREVAN